jgi:sugar O-acyltransferase (sialic acid O-acetyltransferase NeuD family)
VSRLAIVGAGGHGREVLDVVEALNVVAERDGTDPVAMLGFVADHADDALLARRGVAHLGTVDDLVAGHIDALSEPAALVLAIGDAATRHQLATRIAATPHRWSEPLVHPAASLGGDVELGQGTVVAAGARITTNVRIGQHVQVNVNAVVSHDCRVGDHATLSPGSLVNGSVTLGEGVFLGTGAVVTPGRRVGDWAVVGAGAVVLADVPDDVTVVGVPAVPKT